jgi:hypothetical protein
VISFGKAAPPWKLTFLGGGPNEAGSFKVDKGREMRSGPPLLTPVGAVELLPLPIRLACMNELSGQISHHPLAVMGSAYHLVDTFEVTPPTLSASIFAFRVPASSQNTGNVAHCSL